MNILIIVHEVSFPLKSGGDQAVYNAVNYIKKSMKSSKIYLLYRKSRNRQIKRAIFSDVEIISFRENIFQLIQNKIVFLNTWFRKALSFFLNNDKEFQVISTLESGRYYSNSFIELINNTIKDKNIDVVDIEYYENIFLVYSLPPNVKKIFVHLEIRYIRNERFFNQLNYELNKNDLLIFNRSKSEEILALNQYDIIVTLTENDKKILIEDGVIKSVLTSPAWISEIIDCNFTIAKNCLSFVGGYNHFPNYDGICWFLDKVWNSVLQDKPDLILRIVGIWPNKIRNKIVKSYKNVEFSGFVENLSDVLNGSILIVPLKIGSGMRMKIIDSAMRKVPFITTPVGVEGLYFIDNEDCYICDDEYSFSEKIIKLLEDINKQKIFADNAYRKYKEYYSEERLGNIRLSLYRNLLSKPFDF
jgi:glycosyltransferase involved in cell wall biosynthesis